MKSYRKSNKYAPIAVFAYNRPVLLRQTIDDLRRNHGAIDSDLKIFIDGPKTDKDYSINKEIIKFILSIEGFKTVTYHAHARNIGLKRSILFGVNHMLERYDRIIVLEDDLRTSPYFLDYMNAYLELYKNEKQVCQISGYSYLENDLGEQFPDATYFILGGDCLAWGTWRRAWKVYNDDSIGLYRKIKRQKLLMEFDRNGSYPFSRALRRNAKSQKSWAINWLASTFLLDMLTLYPVKSLARHVVDMEEPGTNYKKVKSDPLNVALSSEVCLIKKINICARKDVEMTYQKFLSKYKTSVLKRFFNWFFGSSVSNWFRL